MGKTETIKERAIYVYLPSEQMTKRWKELAAERGQSVSRFVFEQVENSLAGEEGVIDVRPRIELVKELAELNEQVGELRKDVQQKRIVIDRLEEELQGYREASLPGGKVGDYERELVDAFRGRKRIEADELLPLLKVKEGDNEAILRLHSQLELLEGYGLIGYDGRGWVWRE